MNTWENPEANAVYVSRLAVLPEFQGRGIGTWCMGKIKRMATDMDREAVRLDAVERDEKLLIFYDGLGYMRRGSATYHDETLVFLRKSCRVDNLPERDKKRWILSEKAIPHLPF